MEKVLISLKENTYLTLYMDKTKLSNDCLRMRKYGKNVFIAYSVDGILSYMSDSKPQANETINITGKACFQRLILHSRRFNEKNPVQ